MSSNPRRSARLQNQEKTVEPEATTIKLKNNQIPSGNCLDFTNNDFQEELNNISTSSEKATELFDKNDVDGTRMYGMFNTPVKSNVPINKNKQRKELQRNKKLHASLPRISEINKEKRKKEKEKYSSSESDNDTESISQENSHENENCQNTMNKVINNDTHKKLNEENKIREPEVPLGRLTRSKAREYLIKPDDYFASQSEKSITSNNTLSKLKNKQFDETKLQELLLNSNHISKQHQEIIQTLTEVSQASYLEWACTMEEGFTVLLHGVGSKRKLINNFHKKMIPCEPTLIINGFFPSLTIKDILDNIVTELLGLEPVSNQSECFDVIERTMRSHPDDRIYLLIHNLDGGMLRSNKAQDILSRLASIPNVKMLASVDHINAPLMWDNVKRARYNFYWVDATTFLPYEAETSYESSLLVQKSGALALLSLQNVFASLTSNAKAIYILLVKYQLENGGNNYSGMAFKDLYYKSREAFLVSSDQALRSQLTEFIDHKLVKNRRNFDGVESLIIPLDDALLKQFLEQQSET